MPRKKFPPYNLEWTPELAYAVGVLVTDGNLSSDGRHVNICTVDQQLAETFAGCLPVRTSISQSHDNRPKRKPVYRVHINDVRFYRWLEGIGLFPAKTMTMGEIDMPNEFFRDFLRGHLDGDGNIRFYIDTYNVYKGHRYANQRLFIRFISASENHIQWLHEKIATNAGVKGACFKTISKNRSPMWVIKFSKKESLRLLGWIYYRQSLPCLHRKRKLAEKALHSIVGETRKEYTLRA